MDSQPNSLTEVILEFEALAHADRTLIRWERVEYAAVELVQVTLEHPDITTEHVIEVAPALWGELLELVLATVLIERIESVNDDGPTQPDMEIPPGIIERAGIGQHKPDAPTAPNRRASALSFLRCTVQLMLDGTRRTRMIEGGAAMDLYSKLYGFAAARGIKLPR